MCRARNSIPEVMGDAGILSPSRSAICTTLFGHGRVGCILFRGAIVCSFCPRHILFITGYVIGCFIGYFVAICITTICLTICIGLGIYIRSFLNLRCIICTIISRGFLRWDHIDPF